MDINNTCRIANSQIMRQEELRECLVKAEALLSIALGENLTTHPQSIIYGFLWTICDLISHARNLHDQRN